MLPMSPVSGGAVLRSGRWYVAMSANCVPSGDARTVEDEWSTRDVVAHLTSYDRDLALSVDGAVRRLPEMPREVAVDVERRNRFVHEHDRHLPVEAVMAEARAVRAELLNRLRERTEEQLQARVTSSGGTGRSGAGCSPTQPSTTRTTAPTCVAGSTSSSSVPAARPQPAATMGRAMGARWVGGPVVLHEVRQGRLWSARPATVAEQRDEHQQALDHRRHDRPNQGSRRRTDFPAPTTGCADRAARASPITMVVEQR
jgi:Mycothiol maleylpyruvate isomerase N-terminal domain